MGDVVLAAGPALLWRTNRSNAGYQSPHSNQMYTILSLLGDMLVPVKLWVEAFMLSEGGGDSMLVESPKDDLGSD